MKSANIEPGRHCNMFQVATYVSTDIMTAYKVNDQLRFGECLRRVINTLLNVRQRRKIYARKWLIRMNMNFRQVCEERIWRPARQVKKALRRRNPV
ncbi:hypothetical protein BX666DRAFT_1913841 [Dichotomocladium elegans]|nr:hypothetical protein BX666DRAFT_1913841 [Dichotomocladium elegans]